MPACVLGTMHKHVHADMGTCAVHAVHAVHAHDILCIFIPTVLAGTGSKGTSDCNSSGQQQQQRAPQFSRGGSTMAVRTAASVRTCATMPVGVNLGRCAVCEQGCSSWICRLLTVDSLSLMGMFIMGGAPGCGGWGPCCLVRTLPQDGCASVHLRCNMHHERTHKVQAPIQALMYHLICDLTSSALDHDLSLNLMTIHLTSSHNQ